jgi:hypothetical protein
VQHHCTALPDEKATPLFNTLKTPLFNTLKSAENFKRLEDPYRPSVRGWRKCKVRETQEVIVGAITGSFAAPAACCWAGSTPAGTCSTPAAPRGGSRRPLMSTTAAVAH